MALNYIRRTGIKNHIPARTQKRITEVLRESGPMPVLFLITDYFRGFAQEHGDEAAQEIVEILTKAEVDLVKKDF